MIVLFRHLASFYEEFITSNNQFSTYTFKIAGQHSLLNKGTKQINLVLYNITLMIVYVSSY